jgi:carboxyl-terminal processing protease
LNHDVAFALDRHEKVIRQILESEIISAYYYQAGAIEAGLNYDKQLMEAVRLLKNPEEYRRILAPQKTKETSSLIKLEKKSVGNVSLKEQGATVFSAIA